MGKSIKITSSAQMEKVACNLEELALNYKQAVEKIYETGSQLEAMWTGEAAQVFKAQMEADRQGFETYLKIVKECAEALRSNKNKYISAEQESLQILQNRTHRR